MVAPLCRAAFRPNSTRWRNSLACLTSNVRPFGAIASLLATGAVVSGSTVGRKKGPTGGADPSVFDFMQTMRAA